MHKPPTLNLAQLQAELVAAGINVHSGLSRNNDQIYMVMEAGEVVDLPAQAAAVLAAHVAVADPNPVAEADIAAFTSITAATTLDQVKTAILTWMASRPGVVVPE